MERRRGQKLPEGADEGAGTSGEVLACPPSVTHRYHMTQKPASTYTAERGGCINTVQGYDTYLLFTLTQDENKPSVQSTEEHIYKMCYPPMLEYCFSIVAMSNQDMQLLG